MDQIELASFAPNQDRNWGEAALNLLSFQVDLWGQLRRATEASRANLPSADWNRKAVITTVVSQVPADYFQLLELDSELTISQSTLETRQESLKLTLDRAAHGIATQLDVRHAEQLVESATESIPQLKQRSNRQRIKYLCSSARIREASGNSMPMRPTTNVTMLHG